jgi:hypothetical protein
MALSFGLVYSRYPEIYSNPSVYEQSVYEFSHIRDAQINTYFFNLRANFREYELHPLANRSLFGSNPSGSNGKLILVLWVFALRAVLEERIKLVNRGITVLQSFQNKFPKLSNNFHLDIAGIVHINYPIQEQVDVPKTSKYVSG